MSEQTSTTLFETDEQHAERFRAQLREFVAIAAENAKESITLVPEHRVNISLQSANQLGFNAMQPMVDSKQKQVEIPQLTEYEHVTQIGNKLAAARALRTGVSYETGV